jgi:hypothetical protein
MDTNDSDPVQNGVLRPGGWWATADAGWQYERRPAGGQRRNATGSVLPRRKGAEEDRLAAIVVTMIE